MIQFIDAGALNVAYSESGVPDGWPVVLLHGFPYDIHAYDGVAPVLAAEGARVIVPYLRGFGPTRFLSPDTPRSGQQAALGADLLALLDGLGIGSAVLAGYDWGGRAACVVAALWPERVRGLVSYNSYNIQDIATSLEPGTAEDEYGIWYQYYFHGERGRAGLAKDRRSFCRLLWRLWSTKPPVLLIIRTSSMWSSIPIDTGSRLSRAIRRLRRSSKGWRRCRTSPFRP
jgi:pimeloyl-ACP methyl ester carboxylesterase